MPSHMPRFSVVITCYNQRSFIGEAVESALAQDYADKEIIVVDDGSTDGSTRLLEGYSDRVTVHLLKANQGAFCARNTGVALAQGDYVLFLDGDDLLLPWALRVYSKIIDLKDPKLIIARLLHFRGELGELLPPQPVQLEIVEYEALMQKDRHLRMSPTAVIERMSFIRSGGWSPDLFHLDDHDLLLRLGYAGRTVQILSPFTIGYRMHEANSINQLDRMLESMVKIVHREKADLYPGGQARRSERYAIIGGFATYWLKRAINAGSYSWGRALLVAGWLMILMAIVRQIAIFARGRIPAEVVALKD